LLVVLACSVVTILTELSQLPYLREVTTTTTTTTIIIIIIIITAYTAQSMSYHIIKTLTVMLLGYFIFNVLIIRV
jgi:hypothetical protein